MFLRLLRHWLEHRKIPSTLTLAPLRMEILIFLEEVTRVGAYALLSLLTKRFLNLLTMPSHLRNC
jgi:hypothetical protein